MGLLILSILSPVIPLSFGFRQRSALLWAYPCVALIFDIAISLVKRILLLNNQWLSNLFVLVEFVILSFVYRDQIFKNDKVFKAFIFFSTCFFATTTLVTSPLKFNISGASFFTFTYIIYGMLGFYALLRRPDMIYLERSWFFWMNTAITLYASGSFLLLLFREYLDHNNRELLYRLWNSMFLTLNITKNLLIAVALYHYKPAVRESH